MPHNSAIAAISTRVFRVPLDEPLQDANRGVQTYFELVTVIVSCADGMTGTGYTYAIGSGGHAIKAMIDRDIAPTLIGLSSAGIDAPYDQTQARLHYVGRGGIASFAFLAIDIVLWDIRGKVTELPLWRIAGGASNTPLTYRGGVDLNFPLDKLLACVGDYLDTGFAAIKIKVGREDVEEDVTRIAAVRERVGPSIKLMIDGNYGYDLTRATAAAKAFEKFDLVWFEEPLIADDYSGYWELARRTSNPLAMGENLHTIEEFKLAYEHSSLTFVQPDTSNCGGVTGFIRAAKLAAEKGFPVCGHGMQELHVNLVGAQRNASWLEVHAFQLDRYTQRQLVIEDGRAVALDDPGMGVRFDWAKLDVHATPDWEAIGRYSAVGADFSGATPK